MAHWIVNVGEGVNSSPTDPSLPPSSGTSSGTFTRAIGDGPWPVGGELQYKDPTANQRPRYIAEWKDGTNIKFDEGMGFSYNFETDKNKKKVFEPVYKGTVLKNEFKVNAAIVKPLLSQKYLSHDTLYLQEIY